MENSPNYRSFLKEALAQRSRQNPAFSLRAFAKKLGISRSYLSEILAGKKRLSLEVGNQISERLNLEGSEAERFRLMIQLDSTQPPDVREASLRKLREISPDVHDLALDTFQVIADWYHLPILELTYLEKFQLSGRSAARKLGISIMEAEAAIERLLRLGLLERVPGGYRKTQSRLMLRAQDSREASRKAHLPFLQKAMISVNERDREDRRSCTEILPLDPALLDRAEAILDRACHEIVRLARKSPRRSRVFALSAHLFALTPPAPRPVRILNPLRIRK